MKEDTDEIHERVCRACNETYNYPVPKSPATRFYCETCAGLDAPVRAVLERYNKRLKSLATTVHKLEQRWAASNEPPARPPADRSAETRP